MKKIALLFSLAVLSAGIDSCKSEGLKARPGEFCFIVKNDELIVSNDTKAVMYYDLIDAELAARVSRIPFDCSNFSKINPGDSKTYKLDSLVDKKNNALIATWWQCNGDKLEKAHNSPLQTNRENQVCSTPD